MSGFDSRTTQALACPIPWHHFPRICLILSKSNSSQFSASPCVKARKWMIRMAPLKVLLLALRPAMTSSVKYCSIAVAVKTRWDQGGGGWDHFKKMYTFLPTNIHVNKHLPGHIYNCVIYFSFSPFFPPSLCIHI